MAKLEQTLNGNFDDILRRIENGILGGRTMKKILLSIGAILLAVVIFSAGLWGGLRLSAAHPDFPTWEIITEPDTIRDSLELTASGLFADVRAGNMIWDELEALITDREEGTYISSCPYYRVDYRSFGAWYTVYTSEYEPYLHDGDEQYRPATLRFPNGLFSQPGRYRVYLDGLGYVGGAGGFDIASVPTTECIYGNIKDETPPTFNSFPYWVEVLERENFSDHAKLEFVSLVVRGDTARLTMNLINTSETANLVYGKEYRVDYLADDRWHTVNVPYAVPMVAEIQEPGTERTKTFIDTANVFSQPGTYRYYLSDVAYCQFEIE